MTKERLNSFYLRLALKTKKEFADEFKLAYSNVNNWGVSNPYPPYLECVFKWVIKARKYDELMRDLQQK